MKDFSMYNNTCKCVLIVLLLASCNYAKHHAYITQIKAKYYQLPKTERCDYKLVLNIM